MIFHTPAGLVSINTEQTERGLVAELTSVAPRVADPPEGLVAACLEALHWSTRRPRPELPADAGQRRAPST